VSKDDFSVRFPSSSERSEEFRRDCIVGMIIFRSRSDHIIQCSIRRIVALKMNLDYAEERTSKIVLVASIAGSTMLLNRQSSMLRLKDAFAHVFTDAKGNYPGLNFGVIHLNLSNSDCLKIEITNHDDEAIQLHCRLDSLHSDPALQLSRYTRSGAQIQN
jgi:hypothetical protein